MNSSVFYLFGPSGCGKSTVGSSLAEATGGVFLDGDDFHPPANKEKMGAGISLQDADRWPWFDILKGAARKAADDDPSRPVFVACSALKRSYRDYLRDGESGVRFVWLDGSKELISSRIAARNHEYMPASLLDSQFAAFEQPTDDEGVVRVSIDQQPSEIVAEILAATE